jgi:hypothetical protein
LAECKVGLESRRRLGAWSRWCRGKVCKRTKACIFDDGIVNWLEIAEITKVSCELGHGSSGRQHALRQIFYPCCNFHVDKYEV